MIGLQYYKSLILYGGGWRGDASFKCISRHLWKKKSITNAVAKLVQTAGGNRDGSDILQSEKEKDCLRVVFNA